ncbi:MAG: HDOD domain-containing protein [Rhodocyclaceae bacterium]|nr:HDOD domain-containing protein [Rhodocyclaceae bacterium]
MFGFLRRLFGKKALAKDDQPVSSASVPDPLGPLFTAPVRVATPILVQRDEIIDTATRICGYRFTVRRPDANDLPDGRATLEALRTANVASFAERRMALLFLPALHWTIQDFRPLMGPKTVVLLDLPGRSLAPGAWREVSAAIRAQGARVGVDGADLKNEWIGEYVDLALLDFSAYTIARFEQLLSGLKQAFPRLEILVENVASWPERRLCVSLGAAYCLGPFTTSPDEEQQSGELSPSRMVVFEMLNLLRKGADLPDIAKVAKRDLGVAIKLIGMANSPLLALASPVTGIDQAMMVLGRDQLYRWLSLAMFRTGAGSPRDEVLLELALSRGRFLELVGSRGSGNFRCDELFLVGLLSLLDTLLGMPMETVVERLHLSADIRQVLLHGTGPFGFHLALAISVEKGRTGNVASLAEKLGIPLDAMESASAEAMDWAEGAVNATS